MINNGSGNGLVPSGTKPLPEPILIYLQQIPVNIINNNSNIVFLEF